MQGNENNQWRYPNEIHPCRHPRSDPRVLHVAAPGYHSVQQGFVVDVRTDTDYVLEVVFEAVGD